MIANDLAATAAPARGRGRKGLRHPVRDIRGREPLSLRAVVSDRTDQPAALPKAQWEVALPGLRASVVPFLVSRVIVLVALVTARLCVTSFKLGAAARGAESFRPARLGRTLVREDRRPRLRGPRKRSSALSSHCCRCWRGRSGPCPGMSGGAVGDRRCERRVPWRPSSCSTDSSCSSSATRRVPAERCGCWLWPHPPSCS